jgi:Bacterial extracellular solute-binding protein
MRYLTLLAAVALAVPGGARAEGVLNIYNWGDYTSPEMIEKFEKQYNIDVTITDYDSNDTALAKVKAGAHGFDIVVPSANFLPVWIDDGLLLESRPDQMENFTHVDPQWVDVPFDPGRRYSVPWQWGVTGVAVNTEHYKGPIDTWGVVLEPPPELAGKINVVPEMSDIVGAAVFYVGGESCTGDKEVLRKARDVLVAAKPNWLSVDYGALTAEEQARVLLAEGQEAAIGAQGREVAGEGVDRAALGGGDQALQGLGLVKAAAQVDPGVQRQEGAERDVVGLQTGQEDGDDRERVRSSLGRLLPVEAELDLAVLPAADPGGAEQDDQGTTARQRRLQLRLPGLAAGEGVAVEEGLQAGVPVEAGAQPVRRRAIGAAVA